MNHYEQKQEDRRKRLEEAADRALSDAAAASTEARKRGSLIPFGQPILVGHHSEGRDRRFRAGIGRLYGKSFALQEKSEQLAAKAAAVGTGGISSDDPDAVKKLRAELEAAEQKQAYMKACNKAIRSGKTEDAQLQALAKLGVSESKARELITPDFCRRVGYPAYRLQNNNANIKRIKDRITVLESRQNRTPVEVQASGYTYREDVEANRAMFIFDGKPDADTIALLKRHAFKWAPSRKAWQRQASANGVYAAQLVRQALDKRNA